MRDHRLGKAALIAGLALACLLSLVSAHASTVTVSDTVLLPGALFTTGDAIDNALSNDVTGSANGTFGYWFAIPSAWVGKPFSLRYPGSEEQPVVADPTSHAGLLYMVDMDVYFHGTWTVDGTVRHWDNSTGVNPGSESGTIPDGVNGAFVVISAQGSPGASNVAFDFVVTTS